MKEKDSQKTKQALDRGVLKIYPDKKSLEKVLLSKRKLKIYNGIDPTGQLHLGHAVVFRKLRQFQNLGHHIIILIGDFTATIGDPTGKSVVRRPLSRQQVLNNASNYKKQIAKFLDFKKPNVEFLYNSQWINKLKSQDIIKITSFFTVARLLERDMFQERIKKGRDIHLHEFIYPVFQAYDSLAMDIDMELGGNDQMFNMMQGRALMKAVKNKEKFVMTLKLLTDPSGKKMGKSEKNSILLSEQPDRMFGKIMSWPDSFLKISFELFTDLSFESIEEMLKNPRQAKAELAKEIVSMCYSRQKALAAEKEFNKVFQKKELPSKIKQVCIKSKSLNILDLLFQAKLVSSKGEAKRLILQKGVKIDGKVQNDWKKNIRLSKGMIIQVGKRKFIKIV